MAAPLPLGPAKVVLLAVHFATQADINSLSSLTAQHAAVLRQDLVLRILLTHLPETIKPELYVSFVLALTTDDAQPSLLDCPLDTTVVDSLSDDQASRKVKKLRLIHLSISDEGVNGPTDSLTSFLLLRGYRMDEEAGMLTQLPDLLTPFLQHSPAIQTWLVSTVLPLLRRNHEYYPQKPVRYSLLEFHNLPDRTAIDYLLAETGLLEDSYDLVGRDFSGLVGPWLYNDSRWKQESFMDASSTETSATTVMSCPGWEQALEWLVLQASKSWRISLKVIEQWDGPEYIDLIDDVNMWFQEPQQRYLDLSYAQAALASAYLIPEATADALEGAYKICSKIASLMDQGSNETLQSAASVLAPIAELDRNAFPGAKTATYMRNDLLKTSNPLTNPNSCSTNLLMALVLSAFLLARAGVPCTVRRAGDLVFIQDPGEQKGELTRLLRNLSANLSKTDDACWIRARNEILWLQNWGSANSTNSVGSIQGVFGTMSATYIEMEILKALLSNSRYTLARSLYEDALEKPLPADAVQSTVQNCALGSFDNASNPNRSRGGLKRCNEIINAFPKTVGKGLPSIKRIEALLKATHALSDYRLVLKQGEPFSPVVLRVHSDPISIIERVLEQNAKAYTRLQEFLELGNNMVSAGLPTSNKLGKSLSAAAGQDVDRLMTEKRIVAMCIEAALREDDFETAYSYVVSRLGTSTSMTPEGCDDEWSWKAALDAGKSARTETSQKPTHLGTASGNPEIRHLEQRIECLATALRIAPANQLQEVLKTFRRCEEQLDSAIKEEAAKEDAWDAAGDLRNLPGAFDGPDPDKAYPPRNITASAAARQADESPMSLFDLSRATARVASRNLTALSSLQGIAQGTTQPQSTDEDDQEQHRTRKRDQLREAATGTLVSGVGWLIGASVNRPTNDDKL
ncbi:Sec39 domain-containing protein [Ilyonectria robusta]|uniref:Sec39 domain-containing protein n=1 Tax=Ilyonectria robusta TaxID=1079257 RepID=UPI001E8E0548|nr:Sec39 domain-containing protein [Ilyonectria robusta]KAH8661329.1 Sec39 domain-containing protein [Ilyonectria robusta]